MKNTLLLPRKCRMIGLVLLIPFVVLFILTNNENFVFSFLDTSHGRDSGMFDGNYNLTDELAISGIIISLFMIAFSRLRLEDEYTTYIRLQSLQIGVYVNYAVFILLTFVVYGIGYLSVLFYNIATILVLFILVFNYKLYITPRISKSQPA